MAKFLVEASYSDEGLKGLIRDKAAGRRAAAAQALTLTVEELDQTLSKASAISRLVRDDQGTTTAAPSMASFLTAMSAWLASAKGNVVTRGRRPISPAS
jgi:hypothetical protein